MSWSHTLPTGDLHDQMTILIGSAIRLLCGEAGVFVVSNEAFDPQSSSEYTLYRLSTSQLPLLLVSVQEGVQPNSRHLLVTETLLPTLVEQFNLGGDDDGEGLQDAERCSLFVHDHAGVLGVLHYIRPRGARSCFEQGGEVQGTPQLFVTHLAASLRSALKSQALVKEQGRLAAIFEH